LPRPHRSPQTSSLARHRLAQAGIAPSKGGRAAARSGEKARGRRGSSAVELSGGHGGTAARPRPTAISPPLPAAYPAAARAQRLEGTVLLLVSVDSAGRVARAEIQRSSGHACSMGRLESVRSWRFEPARQDGAPTAAQVEVPVRFRFG